MLRCKNVFLQSTKYIFAQPPCFYSHLLFLVLLDIVKLKKVKVLEVVCIKSTKNLDIMGSF